MSELLRQNRLGSSEAEVTELGLGTSGMGNLYREVSPCECGDVFAEALDAGMRYFDTAPFYGLGLSESRLGQLLASNSDKVAVSTKVGRLLHGEPTHETVFDFVRPMHSAVTYDYTYDGIMRSFEQSCTRLGLVKLDIAFVHDIGIYTHGADHAYYWEQLRSSGYKALNELRSAGRVKAIGLGVNETRACLEAPEIGQWDCFLLANRLTILEQENASRLLNVCRRANISLIIGGIYNSGILAVAEEDVPRAHYEYGPASLGVIKRVLALHDACKDFGISLKAAALQFPRLFDATASTLLGSAKPGRVHETIELWRMPIPVEFWQKLLEQGLIDPKLSEYLCFDNCHG